MQAKTKLSICIPTYNFASYIGDTLASIIGQMVPGVEIVVLDGASTDNTQAVVSRYQKDCGSLAYYRQDFKGGIDVDMAKAVELTHGEYCWLMSADDLIKPGALKRILSEIESGMDIYLCNRTECDINMAPFRNRYFLHKGIADKIFNLHENKDFISYLNSSTTTGTLFSYMSSIIFKKSRWEAVLDKEYAYGTCYGHAYILFSLTRDTCMLKYIRQPLVFCRIGNDSFSSNGFIKRVAIDFDGYRKIADKLFNNDPVMKGIFKAVIKKEYSLFRLIKIRAFSNDSEWQEITPKLIDIGYQRLSIYICGLMKLYKPVISHLVKLKQIIAKARFYLNQIFRRINAGA
jgi:abequosyltransferase